MPIIWMELDYSFKCIYWQIYLAVLDAVYLYSILLECLMRKIIHIDCDCFYAAVEVRDFPELAGQPVAVGGHSKRRGVLATCNYEAREFGLHAAMPTVEAFSRCAHLQLMPARFDVYKQVSAQMHDIFLEYTSIIEPLSLDEAFLDVSQCTLFGGSATYIAQDIRQKIQQRLGITASAGIASNKLLAKVASDWNKPDGQTVVLPNNVAAFVKELPLKKIPGVGRVTLQKMQGLGLNTCGDLQRWSETEIVSHFGKFGDRLVSYRFGVDNRAVTNSRQRKSLSVERTFESNLNALQDYSENLLALHAELLRRLNQYSIKEHKKRLSLVEGSALVKGKFNNQFQTERLRLPQLLFDCSIRSLQIKVKLADFSVQTREVSFRCSLGESGTSISLENFSGIFEAYIKQYKQEHQRLPFIRLLGVGVNFTYVSSRKAKALTRVERVANERAVGLPSAKQLSLFN